MSTPRFLLPGATYAVSRRCLERRFYLRPHPEINLAFRYCLGLAMERTGILLHAYVVMSTHFHLVLTDPDQRLPEFMQLLDLLLAKCMNVALKRPGQFWAQGSYSAVRIASDDVDAVLQQLAYVITNPCAAGLVATPADWPGNITLPQQLARDDAIVEERPKFFFRREDQEGRRDLGDDDRRPRPEGRTGLPGAVAFCLTRPPQLAHLPDDQLRSEVARAVAARLATIAAERKKRGETRILGAKGAWDQDPHASPTTTERIFALNPRFAGRLRRRECAQDLVTFWTLYPVALRAYCDGDHHVVFPAGTYLMRVRYRVACRAPEPG